LSDAKNDGNDNRKITFSKHGLILFGTVLILISLTAVAIGIYFLVTMTKTTTTTTTTTITTGKNNILLVILVNIQ